MRGRKPELIRRAVRDRPMARLGYGDTVEEVIIQKGLVSRGVAYQVFLEVEEAVQEVVLRQVWDATFPSFKHHLGCL